jgi:predicted nucleic acid-binding protein
MMTNLLIDTNVWIYAGDKSSIFYPKATAILSNPDYNFFTTSKNISEFFAVTSKQKISYESSSNYYEEIKTKATILFPNQNSLSVFETLLTNINRKETRYMMLKSFRL